MSLEFSAFVIAEPSKCTGCRACEVACFAGHRATAISKTARTVGTVICPVIPRLYLTRKGTGETGRCMPVQCHHCEDAPCMRSCQTGALSRVDGAVVLDERKCIGCKNCAVACPFGAVEVFSRDEITQAADGKVCCYTEALKTPKLVFKCDLCVTTSEGTPACVKTCPNEALRLVDPATELESKRIAAVEAADLCTK